MGKKYHLDYREFIWRSDMAEIDLTEAAAWALIASAVVYGLAARYGRAAAAIGAALAAFAVKAALLDTV
jgi:hypothetical protein